MDIPSDIIQEFGIPDVSSGGGDVVSNFNSIDTNIENQINGLFNNQDNKSSGPVEPVVEQPKVATPAPVSNQTATSTTPPIETVDPVKLFAEASPKAFFTDSGELDTTKINDHFLSNGKSFMKYTESAPVQTTSTPDVAKQSGRVDPVKDYQTKVSEIVDNFGAIVQDQMAKGFTHEQALENVSSHFAMLKNELQQRQDVAREIELKVKELSPELERARQDRIAATINRNVVELATPLDGLIPGMDGGKVLNQFILSPQYGGAELDRMILKDHPNFKGLPVEDQNKLASEWFNTFQQDRAAMAHVAEFGRLRWMVENFKPILEHAQKVGEARVVNSNEAKGSKPSNLISFQKSNGVASDVNKFFGFDSVN